MTYISFSRLYLSLLIIFLICSSGVTGQDKQDNPFKVVFYNVENLFDTFDDPATNDEEFTPSGKNHWTKSKLDHKIMMVYRALISASDGHFPDIIGLAEIENLWVLDYLLKNTPLKNGNYGIIHKESPDLRGVDVALFYRKSSVVPVDFKFIPVSRQGSSHFLSRDILLFKAKLDKETLYFFVNHWPSRSGGYVETVEKRDIAARIVRKSIDSLRSKDAQCKVLLMGDFNATPEEECFTKILGATLQNKPSGTTQLINLSQLWLKDATGTIRTRGHWEIFDQFICSTNLYEGSGLHISKSETHICTDDFLLEPDTRYLGKKPFRTYLGPVYHGGISDHLPISTTLRKEVTKLN